MKKILQTIDLKMTYQIGKVSVNALRGVNLDVEEYSGAEGVSPTGRIVLYTCHMTRTG